MKPPKTAGSLLAMWVLGCTGTSDNELRTPTTTDANEMRVLSVRLIDPRTWYSESEFFGTDSGVHFRVEVTVGTRTDTVPGVLVVSPPVVSSDSLSVSGVALDPHGVVRGIFWYNLVDRSLLLNSTPGPGYTPYSEASLSADGAHLAYLANDRNYHFWLAVLSWPECDIVIESPRVATRCTEFWGNVLRWIGTDSLELYMNLCNEERWARASGALSSLGFGVDTVGIAYLEALRPEHQ